MARLAIVLVALMAVSPAAAAEPDLADTGYLQTLKRIDARVWVLAEPKFQVQPIGNVTIVEQSDGVVLVDAGGSPGAGRRIVEMVKSLSSKPVKAVIISQWHGDKPQGLTEILKAWPDARTISTAATQAHLSDPKTMNSPAAPDPAKNASYLSQQAAAARYMQSMIARARTPQEQHGFALAARSFGQYAADLDGALTVAPKEGFTDRLDIADAQAPVQVLFFGRGNTDGDAVVWLPKQKILVAGELVILPFPYGYESYPADWIATLGKLRSYDFRWLVPGHGAPQRDRRQIDRIAAALKDVRGQVAPLVAQGLSLDAVRARVTFDGQAKIFVGHDPWLRRWFMAFWAQPIVDSAYKEARGEPIVQGLGG